MPSAEPKSVAQTMMVLAPVSRVYLKLTRPSSTLSSRECTTPRRMSSDTKVWVPC
jgi:hypothetical protein